MTRALAISRNDLRLLLRDVTAPIVLVVMPLVIIAFVKPAWRPVLHAEGHSLANGSEQAVPGAAVMFSIFMVGYAGMGFFREFLGGTWSRLRAMPVRPIDLMVGKIIPVFVMLAAQQAVLFAAGALLFGLDVRGSMSALFALELAWVLWLGAFILCIVIYARTFQQVLAVSNLGAILFASLGGALTPLHTLPGWARTIAPATPVYWVMDASNKVLLDARGFSAIIASLAVLGGTTVILLMLAAWGFRFDAEKQGVLV